MTTERDAMTLEQVRDRLQVMFQEGRRITSLTFIGRMVDAIDARLSRTAEPVGYITTNGEFFGYALRPNSGTPFCPKERTDVFAHPPEPARDAATWKLAFINERARTYQSKGMKIEQARIHAETDAAHGLIAMAQESGNA